MKKRSNPQTQHTPTPKKAEEKKTPSFESSSHTKKINRETQNKNGKPKGKLKKPKLNVAKKGKINRPN